jgi:hypothetical protein
VITPRLTGVMMAVTALIGAGPVAAFAQAESEATAGQLLNDLLFDNDAAQTSATPQTNAVDDSDRGAATQANAPVQAQTEPVAADIEILLELLENPDPE